MERRAASSDGPRVVRGARAHIVGVLNRSNSSLQAFLSYLRARAMYLRPNEQLPGGKPPVWLLEDVMKALRLVAQYDAQAHYPSQMRENSRAFYEDLLKLENANPLLVTLVKTAMSYVSRAPGLATLALLQVRVLLIVCLRACVLAELILIDLRCVVTGAAPPQFEQLAAYARAQLCSLLALHRGAGWERSWGAWPCAGRHGSIGPRGLGPASSSGPCAAHVFASTGRVRPGTRWQCCCCESDGRVGRRGGGRWNFVQLGRVRSTPLRQLSGCGSIRSPLAKLWPPLWSGRGCENPSCARAHSHIPCAP